MPPEVANWKRSRDRLEEAEELLARLHLLTDIPAARRRGPFSFSELQRAANILIGLHPAMQLKVVFFTAPSAPAAILGADETENLIIVYLSKSHGPKDAPEFPEPQWRRDGERSTSPAQQQHSPPIEPPSSPEPAEEPVNHAYSVRRLCQIFGGDDYCLR